MVYLLVFNINHDGDNDDDGGDDDDDEDGGGGGDDDDDDHCSGNGSSEYDWEILEY